ncbi:MAG: hypothetical protein F4Y26_11165 [Gammaproteobacteria bacterium]|nr:hypothetical protein [Gammaproteobacteria bacterium]
MAQSHSITTKHYSCLRINQAHVGRGVVVEFPVGGDVYRLGHDELVRIAGETTPFLESHSWRELRAYSTGRPSRKTLAALEPYRVTVGDK